MRRPRYLPGQGLAPHNAPRHRSRGTRPCDVVCPSSSALWRSSASWPRPSRPQPPARARGTAAPGRAFDQCTGEYFDNIFNAHFVETDSGHFHFNDHLEGIGESSGSRYVGNNVDNEFFHAPADGTFMIDQVLNLRVVSKGNLPNSWLTIRIHLVVASDGNVLRDERLLVRLSRQLTRIAEEGREVLAPGPLLSSSRHYSADAGSPRLHDHVRVRRPASASVTHARRSAQARSRGLVGSVRASRRLCRQRGLGPICSTKRRKRSAFGCASWSRSKSAAIAAGGYPPETRIAGGVRLR